MSGPCSETEDLLNHSSVEKIQGAKDINNADDKSDLEMTPDPNVNQQAMFRQYNQFRKTFKKETSDNVASSYSNPNSKLVPKKKLSVVDQVIQDYLDPYGLNNQ